MQIGQEVEFAQRESISFFRITAELVRLLVELRSCARERSLGKGRRYGVLVPLRVMRSCALAKGGLIALTQRQTAEFQLQLPGSCL
jgi:hypothetical protein